MLDFSDILKDLRKTVRAVPSVYRYFIAYGYGVWYNRFAENAAVSFTNIEEVRSGNYVLLDAFIAHLIDNWQEHIDIKEGTFFKKKLAGDVTDLLNWQEAGYSISRTPKNYIFRLNKWKTIYEGKDIQITTKKGDKKIIKYDGVDYKKVIENRQREYTISKVPFWFTFNYGSDGSHTPREGYPARGGTFFYERTESEVDYIFDKITDCFSDFYTLYLLGKIPGDKESAKIYLKTEFDFGLSTYDIIDPDVVANLKGN